MKNVLVLSVCLLAGWSAAAGIFPVTDADLSGSVNALDVQLGINEALGIPILGDTTAKAVTTGGGIVKADPVGPTWPSGSVVKLTAVPDTGWQFIRWEGDVTGSANPTNITMNGNKIVRAVFTELPHYTLTVTVGGSGSVAKNPDQADYIQGAGVSLTATPATGWRFDHWENGLTGSTNPATVVMTANKTVKAVFVQDLPNAPVITKQPVDWSGDSGETATFSVTATGSGLSYKWYNDSGAINGAIAADFSFVADEVYEGLYWCVVTNSGGSVTSNKVHLYVNGRPEFRLTYTDGSGLIQADFNANGAELSTFIIGGLGANEQVIGVGLAFMWPTSNPAHFAMEIEPLIAGLLPDDFSEVVEFKGTSCIDSAGNAVADFSLEASDMYLAYPVFKIKNTVTAATRVASGNTDQIDLTLNDAPVALVGGNYELVLGGGVVKYSLTIEAVGGGDVLSASAS